VQDLHDLVGIGPTAAGEVRQEPARLAGDHLAVGDDVELAALARPDLDVEAQLVLDLRGETRRATLVASSGAVEDRDLHRGTS
jgi:hypothetical protein